MKTINKEEMEQMLTGYVSGNGLSVLPDQYFDFKNLELCDFLRIRTQRPSLELHQDVTAYQLARECSLLFASMDQALLEQLNKRLSFDSLASSLGPIYLCWLSEDQLHGHRFNPRFFDIVYNGGELVHLYYHLDINQSADVGKSVRLARYLNSIRMEGAASSTRNHRWWLAHALEMPDQSLEEFGVNQLALVAAYQEHLKSDHFFRARYQQHTVKKLTSLPDCCYNAKYDSYLAYLKFLGGLELYDPLKIKLPPEPSKVMPYVQHLIKGKVKLPDLIRSQIEDLLVIWTLEGKPIPGIREELKEIYV